MDSKPENKGKKFQGQVVSNKMDKTVVVQISSVKKHLKYKKQYSVTKKFQAHDENNEYQIGDVVEIQEVRPISRHKKWTVIKKVK